jgi:predicted butyrate kinase (DUF1464 family)
MANKDTYIFTVGEDIVGYDAETRRVILTKNFEEKAESAHPSVTVKIIEDELRIPKDKITVWKKIV